MQADTKTEDIESGPRSGSRAALLVGAGDAIGAAVARRFAIEGYKVCIARRDASKAQPLVDEMAAAGRDVRAYSVDARQEAQVQGLCEQVESDAGPIEVCLFNAGANAQRPLLETTGEQFFKSWELACYAGFLVGREATRCMLRHGRGTMLFTGATASLRGGKGFATFAAAKFGLRAIAQSMAREFGPKNIHVVHLILDGAVNSAAIHRRMKAQSEIEPWQIPADSLAETASIAEAHWFAHMQTRDAWTHELDLRPSVEPW